MRRFIIIAIVLATMALAGNVARQHFYCGWAWSDCSPVETMSCEPVDRVLDLKTDYEEMARQQASR